jgi:hypothetical protein
LRHVPIPIRAAERSRLYQQVPPHSRLVVTDVKRRIGLWLPAGAFRPLTAWPGSPDGGIHRPIPQDFQIGRRHCGGAEITRHGLARVKAGTTIVRSVSGNRLNGK